jgi:GntR family transcriptional regulator/MocR family aminotransferase
MSAQFAVAKSVIDGQRNIITQAIVYEFIRQGHFSRHIRGMRLLYKKAQDDLVNLINLHLKNKLTLVATHAGMHFIAWLPPAVNALIIEMEALKEGVIVHNLSKYSIEFDHLNG